MKAPPSVDVRAVGRGALLGLCLIVPLSVLQEIVFASVDDPCSDSVVFLFFLLFLAAFCLAGYRAARAADVSPYTHGVLGSLGALAAWIPLHMGKNLIFGGSFVSDDCGTANDGFVAVAASVLTMAMLAMTVGVVGGMLAGRRRSER